jgi:hypothetical protein
MSGLTRPLRLALVGNGLAVELSGFNELVYREGLRLLNDDRRATEGDAMEGAPMAKEAPHRRVHLRSLSDNGQAKRAPRCNGEIHRASSNGTTA